MADREGDYSVKFENFSNQDDDSVRYVHMVSGCFNSVTTGPPGPYVCLFVCLSVCLFKSY